MKQREALVTKRKVMESLKEEKEKQRKEKQNKVHAAIRG